MAIIKPYIWIVFMSFSLVMLFKKSFGRVLTFSFITGTFFLYITGFINNIRLGYYLSSAFSLTGLCLLLIKIIRKEDIKEDLSHFLTSGFFFFTLIYVLICFYHRNSLFTLWDELSHWGVMVKEMMRTNSFYCLDSSYLQVHKDYPPFVSLLETLFCFLFGQYKEKYLYMTLSVFSFSFVLSLTDDGKPDIKTVIKQLISIAVFFLISAIDYMPKGISNVGLESFLSSVYTDFLMALMAAYVCHLALNRDKHDLFSYVSLSLVLPAMMMVKQISLAFYAMFLFIVIMKRIINKNKDNLLKDFVFFIVIPVIIYAAWGILIKRLGISGQFSFGDISLHNLFAVITGNLEGYRETVIQNYRYALLNRSLIGTITYPILNLIILILLSVFHYFRNRKVSEGVLAGVTYLIGTVGYALAMAVIYAFSMTEYEAVSLASFERYMTSYVCIGILLLLFASMEGINDKHPVIPVILLVLLGLFSIANINRELLKPRPYTESFDESYQAKELYGQVSEYINRDDYVMIITQQYEFYLPLRLEYNFPGYHFKYKSYGIEGYDFSENISSEQFYSLIKDFDYIYLYDTDDVFYQKYWKDIQKESLLNNRLYKIEGNEFVLMPWISG